MRRSGRVCGAPYHHNPDGYLFPPLKRCLVNLVVKRLKRMVPVWDIPSAVSFNAALQIGAHHTLMDVPLGRDDIALLQYTGGTAGTSKGAILTHGSLVANIEQTSTWIGSTPTKGEEVAITPPPLVEGNADQPDLDQADQEGQGRMNSSRRSGEDGISR